MKKKALALTLALLLTALAALGGCADREPSAESFAEEFLTLFYNTDAGDWPEMQEAEANALHEEISSRYEAYFTADCYSKFAADRGYGIIVSVVQSSGSIKLSGLSLSELSSSAEKWLYLAEGSVTYSDAGGEKELPLSAEIQVEKIDGQLKISSLFFRKQPVA